MKSIQTKIISFILIYMVLLAVIIGVSSTLNISNVARKDSSLLLNEVNREKTMELDYQLKIVEHTVDTIYGCAVDRLESVEALCDREYRESYTHFVRGLSLDLAKRTDGSLAVYFRFNPELVGNGVEGFFWSRRDGTEEYTEEAITDLLAYNSYDVEHVGWYYVPVDNGDAMWMAPYYNQNINKSMISYVIPFYAEGQLVGVVGMDIDFDIFLEMAQDITLYENTVCHIVGEERDFIYIKSNGMIERRSLDNRISYLMGESEGSFEPVVVTHEGASHMLVFNTLHNGMKVMILTPVAEINKDSSALIRSTVTQALLLLCLAVITAMYVTRRIVKPLQDITDAAEQFAEGKWDVKIDCHTNDEVKRLTDSVLVMASKTQAYIDQLNDQATRDGLTGVKNKACYLDRTQKLKARIAEKKESFGVIMFDVNNLKPINDTFGHEMGDALLKSACGVICRVFKHSPVFRIGGDEFVVVLQNRDLESRVELIAEFEREIGSTFLDKEKKLAVSVAYGMAVCPEDGEDYDALFALADERMYRKKAEMKGTKAR